MSTVRRFFSDFHDPQRDILITGEELFHLTKVLRAKTGDPVEVTNGRGKLVTGKIGDILPDRAIVRGERVHHEEKPPVTVILAPSLLKKKAMNQLIEKLSEIGVDEIRPVVFGRSDLTGVESGPEKWRKIAIQSLKVNDRLWVPELFEPVRIEEMMAFSRKAGTRIFLDLKAEATEEIKWNAPVLALIGPPGDFSDTERDLLKKNGFLPLRINGCTLKTETAAISIAAILKFKGLGTVKND